MRCAGCGRCWRAGYALTLSCREAVGRESSGGRADGWKEPDAWACGGCGPGRGDGGSSGLAGCFPGGGAGWFVASGGIRAGAVAGLCSGWGCGRHVARAGHAQPGRAGQRHPDGRLLRQRDSVPGRGGLRQRHREQPVPGRVLERPCLADRAGASPARFRQQPPHWRVVFLSDGLHRGRLRHQQRRCARAAG